MDRLSRLSEGGDGGHGQCNAAVTAMIGLGSAGRRCAPAVPECSLSVMEGT